MKFIYRDIHWFKQVHATLVEPDKLVWSKQCFGTAPVLFETEQQHITDADQAFTEATGIKATKSNIACMLIK